MEPRSLHLAGHEDPVADVGRDVSARISHVSALLQQLALRGRFAAPASTASSDAHGVQADDVDGLRCAGCGSRPCQCSVDTREQLKSRFLNAQQEDNTSNSPEERSGRLVSADALQRDALEVWDHHQRQQWAEELRADIAASAAAAGEILSDPDADSAAVLAAARIVVWDTQLAAEAAGHSEAVVQAAVRWRDLDATERWAHYLPDSSELAAHTDQQRSVWLDQRWTEAVPALQRGDAAGQLSNAHAELDAGLRATAAAHGVDHDERGYHRGGTALQIDGAGGDAPDLVEDDLDDRVADIAAWQQRASAEDRDPATIPTPLSDGAIAKARQTRAHTRLIDSDGDVKEAAAHEATDPRAPQPIRPVVNHLTDQPDPTPTPDLDLTDPRHR